MKKLIYFAGLLLSLSIISIASATSTSTSSGFGEPQIINDYNFTGEMQVNGSLKLTWNAYDGDDLKYYKVTRSQTNDDPYYPEDGYIYAGNSLYHYDNNPPQGKTYYRVCAITDDNDRICSGTVILQFEDEAKEGFCIQVITYAKKGDECNAYPTPCNVPEGWATVDSCASEPSGNLKLFAELKDNKPYLQWVFEEEDGAAPHGYKLAISTQNEKPTYPVMSGDSYKYLSHESAKTYHDKNATSGKTYYYRVCLYSDSGECLSYSDAVSIDVPETTEEEEIEAFGELELTAAIKDSKPYLKWEFKGEGAAPHGYKLNISTENEKPTYPPMSGDISKYLSSEKVYSYHDKNANADTYYYRICLYNNGSCTNYSNAVSIKVPITEKATPSTVTFSDVHSGIWFESYLVDFVNRGIIEGYKDGSFKPSRTVNRAEMAKMVVRALGVEVETSDMQIFCDVEEGAWYHSYVLQLYFDNVIEGYTGGDCAAGRMFRGSQEVTRAEGIKIILTMFGATVEPLDSGDQTGFTDVDSSHWAAAYIRSAFSKGIVNGYDDGTFQPNTPLTRAEFVKMLSEAEEVLK